MNSFSQDFVTSYKNIKKTKTWIQKYNTKKGIVNNIQETDTTIIWSLRDSMYSALDITLHFGIDKQCDQETRTFSCDSCYKKALANTIENRKLNWVKINDTTFASKFSKKLLLKTNSILPFSFTISKINISKPRYNFLIGKITKEEYEEKINEDYYRRNKNASYNNL